MLNEDERKLIELRFGNDLNTYSKSKLDNVGKYHFYKSIVPKIRRLLVQEKKEKNNTNINDNIKDNKDNVECKIEGNQLNIENSVQSNIDGNFHFNIENVLQNVEDSNQSYIEENKLVDFSSHKVEIKDYIEIFELLKEIIYDKMMKKLTPKEIIIISLKLGYVDKKYYSNKSISEFLEIEEKEVIEIIKKFLLNYKEKINIAMDKLIENKTGTDNNKCFKKVYEQI